MCVCVQEHCAIDELFPRLKCTKEGLTTEDAEERLNEVGYNRLEEKKVLIFHSILIPILVYFY